MNMKYIYIYSYKSSGWPYFFLNHGVFLSAIYNVVIINVWSRFNSIDLFNFCLIIVVELKCFNTHIDALTAALRTFVLI